MHYVAAVPVKVVVGTALPSTGCPLQAAFYKLVYIAAGRNASRALVLTLLQLLMVKVL